MYQITRLKQSLCEFNKLAVTDWSIIHEATDETHVLVSGGHEKAPRDQYQNQTDCQQDLETDVWKSRTATRPTAFSNCRRLYPCCRAEHVSLKMFHYKRNVVYLHETLSLTSLTRYNMSRSNYSASSCVHLTCNRPTTSVLRAQRTADRTHHACKENVTVPYIVLPEAC